LARYVIALLKKDKSDKDLKRIMIEQLDVFLSEETTRFVERLFDAIASEEYLTVPAAPLITASSASANELDLDQELALAIDGAQDIEAVLAADSPPPPPKDNVINPDSNQVKLEQVSHDAREAEALAFISQEAGIGSQPDVKPAFDVSLLWSFSHSIFVTSRLFYQQHKTKESHNPQSASNYQHHHVRSASPPGRSSGVSGTGGGGAGGAALTAGYADKENQPRDSRRRRASLRSRSRSRSRSNERAFRRSRSRDRRVNDREKTQRQFRNKSPPGSQTDNRHHGRRNFDRRRIGGNADERPRFGNTKSRRSHSRSMSPERNARRNQSSPERVQAAQPNQVPAPVAAPTPVEHPAAHPRQRCRDFDEKGYCVRGETCPWDHGINPVVFEGINNSALMMSMREYNPDAPEIWARGGAPPPGAGQGTVPPPTQPGQTTINPFTGNVRPSTLMSGSGPNGPMGVPNPADYARNPGAPPQSAMMPFPFNPTAVTTPLQRQLIPIPVVDGAPSGGVAEVGKRRFELEDTVAIADVPTKRKVPINSRLGPRVNPNMQQHNSSLELRKVPRGLNTIAHLNNHFAKFGKIVNIQVSYEGDPEAAIVTFSTHAEANVAYRSTEAVLNNRFIKVFWHNDSSGVDVGQMNQMGGGGGGRKNASQYHLHNVPAVPTPNADSAKISNANPLTEAGAGNIGTPTTEQASTAAPASMRLKLNTTTPGGAAGGPGAGGAASGRPMNPTANAASIRKKQEEQQKAVHQLANGLRKRKQELLQSYMKQMKTALELVERMDQQDPQRAPTLQTIKVLQMTIDKLGKEIQAEQDQLQAQIHQQQQQQQPPVKKTKEQQKKELLDMELELIAQQQEGNDTTAIQKRLEELQRNLGVGGGPGANNKSPHFAAASGAPGGGAGRKRPNLPEGPTRVDRRPKAIVVTGFAAEEADFVLGHFKVRFPEIVISSS